MEFLTAKDIEKIMKVKNTKAYTIIKEINVWLESEGLRTARGRVSKEKFAEYYGISTK